MKHKNKTGAIIIEGHVQGLANARALGEIGIPVIVVDKNNCIARYSKYCSRFYKCPDFSSDEFISFMIKLAENEMLNGWSLIPSNDHIVFNLSKNKVLISKYYKTIVPDSKTLKKIYDKNELLLAAEKIGIPVPRTYLLNELKNYETLPYPILIKGREGLTFFKAIGKKGIVANSVFEMNEVIQKLNNKISSERIIVQELIPFTGSEDVWSFTGFSISGRTKTFWIGKKLREHPVKYGTATSAISDYNNDIENFGKKVIEFLDYTGVFEIEFIRDKNNGTFKLIEMNPRTWLWVGLAKYCGINFTKFIYEYLNDIESDYPIGYKRNVVWVNFWTDLFISIKEIIKGDLKFSDYRRHTNYEIVQAVYDTKDIMPFIMMTVMLPYLILKRT